MAITGKLLMCVGLIVAVFVNVMSIIVVRSRGSMDPYEGKESVALKVLYLESALIAVLGIIFVAYNVIEATLN